MTIKQQIMRALGIIALIGSVTIVGSVGTSRPAPALAATCTTANSMLISFPDLRIDAGYRNQIQGRSFQYAVDLPTATSSTGWTTGRPSQTEITFVKAWDEQSPVLFQALTTARRLNSVEFSFVNTSTNVVCRTVKLVTAANGAPVLVSHIDQSAGRDGGVESVSLAFQKVSISDGANTTTWDYSTNVTQ